LRRKKELVVATRNKKKLSELKRLLEKSGIRILCLDDFKGLPKVKEDGLTFRANARKKALSASTRMDKLVMAEDSGLEVSALGNRPGVTSARYGGLSQDDIKNNTKLLREMRGLFGGKRRARFRCVICLAKGKRVVKILEGKVEGRIALRGAGTFGFGYDPVFIPNGYDKTFAKLGAGIKDRISHRAIALRKVRQAIKRFFQRYS